MSRHDDTRSGPLDARYGGFHTADGYLVYDTQRPTTWVESDGARDLTEML